MSNVSRARRSQAVLAAAVIGLSGVAALPFVANAEETSVSAQQQSSDQQVSNATLQWGVKDSFRSYIKGPIARGGWSLDGVSDATPFTWSGGQGTRSGDAMTVAFPGTLSFTGHHGILEMHFRDTRLVVENGQGWLVGNVDSRPFDSETEASPIVTYPDVRFAKVDLSTLTTDNGKISLTNAQVTLTADGAPAFANIYHAGDVLSPLSFSADLKDAAPQRQTSASVASATAADGLTVHVEGSGYTDLPKASTGKDAVGVYAAVVDASIPDEQVAAGNVAGVAFLYNVQKTGTFSKDVTVPTSKLAQDKQYKVVVWAAHGDVTAQTLLYSAPLSISQAQHDALFPAPAPTTEPTSVTPTAEPTTAEPTPTDAPTTAEPTTPAPTTEAPTPEPTTAEPTAPSTAEPTAPATQEPGTPEPTSETTEPAAPETSSPATDGSATSPATDDATGDATPAPAETTASAGAPGAATSTPSASSASPSVVASSTGTDPAGTSSAAAAPAAGGSDGTGGSGAAAPAGTANGAAAPAARNQADQGAAANGTTADAGSSASQSTLASTGASGTLPLVALGSVALLGGGILLALRRRRRA